jgi:hypothetical protein
MPDNLRAKPVTFKELAERTLVHSKANKRSHDHDVWRMPALVDAFGNRAAEEITPGEIQQWLDSKANVWSPATRNRYLCLMKLCYRLAEERGSIARSIVQSSKTPSGGFVHEKKTMSGSAICPTQRKPHSAP